MEVHLDWKMENLSISQRMDRGNTLVGPTKIKN